MIDLNKINTALPCTAIDTCVLLHMPLSLHYLHGTKLAHM